jgi:hemerythrin superfamily protein
MSPKAHPEPAKAAAVTEIPIKTREAAEDSNDIVKVLIKDHRDVEKMVEQLKDAPESVRAGKVKELAEAFMAHGEAEETIVYKTMRAKMEALGRFEESYEEHMKADEALLRVILDVASGDWDTKFAKFVKLFKEHMTEEEETIIKFMNDNMKEAERVHLGKRFKAAKERRINGGEVGKPEHIKSHIQRAEKRSPAAGKAAKLRKTA